MVFDIVKSVRNPVVSIEFNIEGTAIELEFKLEPSVSRWERSSESENGKQLTYKGDDYTLLLEKNPAEGYVTVEFTLRHASGKPFVLHNYVLQTHSSGVGVDRIWMPFHLDDWVEGIGMPRYVKHSGGPMITTAAKGIPLIAAFNRKGITKLAVGFLDQRIETEIRHHAPTTHPSLTQPRGSLNFRLQRPIDGYSLGEVVEHTDGFLISSGSPYLENLKYLRFAFDSRTGRKFSPSPDAAWEPLLAPWGAPKGKWEWLEYNDQGPDDLCEVADLAADLGFKGFVNYNGWFLDSMRKKTRTEMPEITNWGYPDEIGDYVPNPKFPDYKGFISRIKKSGMLWMPWVSPWLAGKNSHASEKLKDAFIEVEVEPSQLRYYPDLKKSFLCPRNPFTQEYVVDLVTKVFKVSEADGFVIDMIDSMPIELCTADHEHNYSSIGIAMADSIDRIVEAIHAINPNALIEFRPRYSNILNMYNATQHRSHDSGEAGAYDMNRRHCLLMRSFIPPGIAVHTDPEYWHIHEKNETVAKKLSTLVISGVPQLCTDIVNMTDDHRRLTKAWLSFYQEHKEDFRHSRMRPIQNDPQFSTILVESDKKAFVSYASFPALKVPLSKQFDEIFLFNCTNEDSLYTILLNIEGEFRSITHHYDLSPIYETTLRSSDKSLLVDHKVSQGGYIALTRA